MGTRHVWLVALLALLQCDATEKLSEDYLEVCKEQCKPLPISGNCNMTTGCVPGGSIIEGIVEAKNCKTLKCPEGEISALNYGDTYPLRWPYSIEDMNDHDMKRPRYKVVCLYKESRTEWAFYKHKFNDAPEAPRKLKTMECIKKIRCHISNPLISDCTGLESSGCQEVDVSNSGTKICPSNKIMFFKSTKGLWSQIDEVKCLQNGYWGTEYKKAKQLIIIWKFFQSGYYYDEDLVNLICTDFNPSEPAPPCPVNHPMISECDSSNFPNECKKIYFTERSLCLNTMDEFSPNPYLKELFFYVKQGDGTWKPEKEIKCDNTTGKWMTESYSPGWSRELNTGDNVVCGSEPDPCELCPNLPPLVCYSVTDCFLGNSTVPVAGLNAGLCRRLTCPADEYLTTNLATSKYPYDKDINEITCKHETKWTTRKQSEEVEITSATCIKKVSCQLTTPLKSDCTGLEDWECEKIYLNDDSNERLHCGEGETLFMKGAAGSNWDQVDVICDFTRGVWKRGNHYFFEDFDDLQANDQVICAVANPSLPPPARCGLCRPLIQAECDVNTGCEVGGQIIEGFTEGNEPCKKLTCPHDEFLITDAGFSRKELICNNDKKWTKNSGKIVEKAVCIKKVSCTVKTPLKSYCTGLEVWGCVEVDLTSDDNISCDLPKTMFFKKAAETTWEETTYLYCDEKLGVWNLGAFGHQIDMQANDQVICADTNPSQLSLAPCKMCPSLPLEECDPDMGCELGGSMIETTSRFPPACRKKCALDEFLITDLWKDGDQEKRNKLSKIHEIECGIQKKWMTFGMDIEESVKSAVCIKKFLCHLTAQMKSDCTGLNAWGCEKIDLNDNGPLTCEGSKNIFFKNNYQSQWVSETNIVCDFGRGVWKRGPKGNQVDVWNDNDGQVVICAISNPSNAPPANCLLCHALKQSDCDPTAGCEVGGPFVKGTVEGIPACKTLTCPHDEFLITDVGFSRKELICNNDKKWMMNGHRIVYEAVCIKRFSCTVKTPLKSDCTGLEAWGCVEVDVTNDDEKFCQFPKALFFKDKDEWDETSNIYCDDESGVWKRGPDGHHVDMQAQVICADSNPSRPPLDPCEKCSPLTQAVCHPSEGCEVGGSIIEGTVAETPACKTLTCPAGEYLFTQSLQAIYLNERVSEVKCNSEKKWMTAGLSQEVEVGGAVCIKKLSCIVKNPLKSDCTGLDAWGCEKVDIKNDDPVKCGSSKIMFVKNDAVDTWAAETKIVCDFARGVWKRGPDGQQVDMQSNDQVICADSEPSPDPCELCRPLIQADCNPSEGCVIGESMIEGTVAGTPACKKLACVYDEHIMTNLGYSKKALTCNSDKKWIMNRRKVVEKAVCIKRISCIVKTPLKSDCTGLDAWGCVEVDLSNDDEKMCEQDQDMFFKPAAGSNWEDAISLNCDEIYGVWKRGPEGEQVNMHANDQVICASSNPSLAASAPRFKRHSSNVAWTGGKGSKIKVTSKVQRP